MKTGFTSRAGACIVAVAERGASASSPWFSVRRARRSRGAAALLDHGFAAFERREVVAEGEDLGEVRIDGREVPVASSGSLVA